MRSFRLGIVEGFYGRPWSWSERQGTASFMRENGYSFYLYAPKGDLYLRRRWREPWPSDVLKNLEKMTETFHSQGIRVGMGLSLHEFHLDSHADALKALERKVSEICSLSVDHVSILFDDMRGDVPGIVQQQIDLVHAVRDMNSSLELSMCPTYYSNDPLLDKLFGARPESYLKELGEGLDPEIEIFWTGEKICSKSYSADHLSQIEKTLGRPVLLWDNYPVNDTESMSRFLHLRAFEGRPASIKNHLSGHLINPMLQSTLSRIPAMTLAESYRLSGEYRSGAAFMRACKSILGNELAELIERDLSFFQDRGLHEMSSEQLQAFKSEYRKYAEHPAAGEVLGWLEGDFRVTREQILAQQ